MRTNITARWTRIFAGCALRSGATRTEPLYNSRMSVLRVLPLTLVLPAVVAALQTISFPTEDGGRICADLYGQGSRAVVLAHGGRFNKESWRDQARALESE